MTAPLRIAWFGPTPSEGGGVAYMAMQVLLHLPAENAEVDLYVNDRPDDLPARLHGLPGIEVISHDSGWRYDAWYSRHPMSTLLSGQATRLFNQRRAIREVERRHAARPYDLVYQFSQFESPGLGGWSDALPPLVVHPETHAGGELRAHLRERGLAKAAGEPRGRRAATVSMFAVRSLTQRAAVRRIAHVIAPSENFARHVRTDYRLAPERVSVVPNPVDLDRFAPRGGERAPGPMRVVVAGRLSARKGAELVVELSHRLADVEGAVEIVVVGGESLWSDYRPLMDGLRPGVARYLGPLRGEEMAGILGGADVLVQPSHYEPFALTVAEALASGVPVVVSDEVGAGEQVDAACCRRFVTGSVEGLERALRGLLADLDTDAVRIGTLARSEAGRLYAPPVVVGEIAAVLRSVASRT